MESLHSILVLFLHMSMWSARVHVVSTCFYSTSSLFAYSVFIFIIHASYTPWLALRFHEGHICPSYYRSYHQVLIPSYNYTCTCMYYMPCEYVCSIFQTLATASHMSLVRTMVRNSKCMGFFSLNNLVLLIYYTMYCHLLLFSGA